MQQEPDFFHNLNEEMRDGKRWLERTVVLAYAAAAGLSVVAFTLLADRAFGLFERIFHWHGGWAVLLWTPACTAAIVWATRRFGPGAGGSGIPQVMAALDPAVHESQRGRTDLAEQPEGRHRGAQRTLGELRPALRRARV